MKMDIEVERVLYPPAAVEGEFFILKTNRGKCAGKMKWRPEIGERLTIEGEWGAYKGERNFKFDSAMPNVPVNPRDQLRYVCDRAPGIGPILEAALWDKYGSDWRDAVAGEVKGFTDAKKLALDESVHLMDLEAEKAQAIGWLMGKGASIKMANAAYEQWKKHTIGVVQANPFRLAELPNYSFTDVDGSVRESFGIGLEDPRRVRAAIVYKLRQLTGNGSTVIEWTTLRMVVCELVGAHLAALVSSECSEMFEDGSLVGFAGTQSVSLTDDYWAEVNIWKFINEVSVS